ncbi:hypothetical protein H0H93_003801, partial [Arthromyces matolae]
MPNDKTPKMVQEQRSKTFRRPVTTSIQNEAAKSKDPSKTQGPEHPSMTTGEDESIPTLVYVEEKGKPHSFTISQGGEENQFA